MRSLVIRSRSIRSARSSAPDHRWFGRPTARLTARPRPYLQALPARSTLGDDVPDRGGAAAAWSAPASVEVLDRLLEDVRAGQSRVLVLRGEAGVGKSALLDHLRGRASGCRLARAAGVESEMELAFAGLHQLCAPMLDRLERLPGAQRDALRTAFGLIDGDAADRFLVGLAVLSLLADAAEEQAAGLPRRRRAVARPGVRADARVRRAPAARRAGGTRVRGA